MKRLVEFPLEDGNTVLMEVDSAPTAGSPTRGLGAREITTKATQTFEDALEKIRPAAEAVITKLRDLSVPPEQIEVEFGIKLSADVSAYIASSSAEANFKVTLTWKRQEK